MFQYKFEYSGNFQFMNTIHFDRMWTMRNTTDVCCGSFSKRVGRKNAMKRRRCGSFRTSIVKSDAATLGCWRVFSDSSSLTHCSVSIVDCFLCSTNRRTTRFFQEAISSICIRSSHSYIFNGCVCRRTYIYIFDASFHDFGTLSAHVIWNISYWYSFVVCVSIVRSCFCFSLLRHKIPFSDTAFTLRTLTTSYNVNILLLLLIFFFLDGRSWCRCYRCSCCCCLFCLKLLFASH